MKSNDRDTRDGGAGLATALDPARVDLNKLRTFAVIAEAGGVSAAASRLALSRSAVSHSLAGLESALGVALFLRVGKKLVLTREGSLLRRAYGDAEGRIADALGTIGESRSEVRGQLRVGLYPGFSRFRLAALLDGFLAAHADTRCRLVHGSRRDLIAQLHEGRLDFVLSLDPDAARTASRIETRPVFSQSLVLALATGVAVRGRGWSRIAALPIVDYFRNEPLIDRWMDHHYASRAGRVPRSNVRAWVGSGTDVALELTRRGVGACVLPEDLVAPYRQDGELRVVRGPRETLRDEIWLHQLADARPTALQAAFRDALS